MVGTVDVDGMLAGMTPHQFDEWWAYYHLEPFGDEWEQAGEICATVHNEIVGIAMGGKATERDLHTPSNYAHPAQRLTSVKPEKHPELPYDPKASEAQARKLWRR